MRKLCLLKPNFFSLMKISAKAGVYLRPKASAWAGVFEPLAFGLGGQIFFKKLRPLAFVFLRFDITLFSTASHILSKERNRLLSHNAEKLIFVHEIISRVNYNYTTKWTIFLNDLSSSLIYFKITKFVIRRGIKMKIYLTSGMKSRSKISLRGTFGLGLGLRPKA